MQANNKTLTQLASTETMTTFAHWTKPLQMSLSSGHAF